MKSEFELIDDLVHRAHARRSAYLGELVASGLTAAEEAVKSAGAALKEGEHAPRHGNVFSIDA